MREMSILERERNQASGSLAGTAIAELLSTNTNINLMEQRKKASLLQIICFYLFQEQRNYKKSNRKSP